jgi:tryptophan synthase alpha chain
MPHEDSALASAFVRRLDRGQSALIPYLTAGCPSASQTPDALEALAASGADIIELGIPFSDPLADGPVIQGASFRALAEGMTVRGVFEILRAFRSRQETPVVLFTYLNPVLSFGVESFLAEAEAAGAQGLLITDLPVGSDPELEGSLAAGTVDLIRLVAPTTPRERIREIGRGARGFLYYISRTGVTGTRRELRADLDREIQAVKAAVSLPVAVGFGISTPDHAALVSHAADGVVVGSALIEHMEAGGIEAGARFLRSLREAMDASRV